MRVLLIPFRVVYKLYYALYFAISLIVFYPFFKFFLSKESRFPRAFKLMRVYAFLWQLFAFAPLKIEGKENIPKKGNFIICPNHSSFMDIPCLYLLFKNYFVFTGKKEIEKWPLFRVFYTSGMNILVDRKNPKGDVKAFKKMIQVLDKGYPLAMFPEGTISKKTPALSDFKAGPFTLAIQKQVPILPITFVSNWKRLQRKGLWKGLAGPGFAHIIIHPPIHTETLNKSHVEELQEKVRNIINDPLKQRYQCA
jgi:1-acyl-sn-glycerol-3-phosphate acyltransferase